MLGAFLLCYMEWGRDQSAFIGQIEYGLLFRQRHMRDGLQHPLIITGLSGQLLLLLSALSAQPRCKIALAGILLLSPAVLMVLVAGIFSNNLRMIGSALPFIGCCVGYFFLARRSAILRKKAGNY